MRNEPDSKPVFFTALRVQRAALGAAILVFAYEVMKASHHAQLVGFNKIDIEVTAFWVLDAMVAPIMTFALVYVALSFERLEHVVGEVAHRLWSTREDLNTTTEEMKNVSKALISEVKIFKHLNSTELGHLENNSALTASLLESLANLTKSWTSLVATEAAASKALESYNIGLLCWSKTIEAYLKEEAEDIDRRILATNVGVYIKLIESLVEEVVKAAHALRPGGARVELFASSNLLPREFYNYNYNWRDGRDLGQSGLTGLGLEFLEDYRERIARWLGSNQIPISLRRVLLVRDASAQDPDLLDLGIPLRDDLHVQLNLKILCTGDIPVKIPLERMAEYGITVPSTAAARFNGHFAYGIAQTFDAGHYTRIRDENLQIKTLREVFVREWHSIPTGRNALFLPIRSDSTRDFMELLPSLPAGSAARARSIRCPDFLAIRVFDEEGTFDRVVACLAAQLKPTYETMLLHLITDEKVLRRVGTCIDYMGRHGESIEAA